MRTKLVSSIQEDTRGFGAGSGTIERYYYECPCGEGRIVEEHDNIPGFRDHDVNIECEKCRNEWEFESEMAVRGWKLVRIDMTT